MEQDIVNNLKSRVQKLEEELLRVVGIKLSHTILYNNQINARALIGQSAVVYCAGKPTEKSRVFWIIL